MLLSSWYVSLQGVGHIVTTHNLAARSREDRDKVNVDLAASRVEYKERLNLPEQVHEVEMQHDLPLLINMWLR
ncbi:hypothetical protein J8I88_20260 (plasmid) [Duffyella gerundensis]|nr:hypothetical protein J8I88_20260 [Duffyella gerundensis]